jgi:hypothetical protein
MKILLTKIFSGKQRRENAPVFTFLKHYEIIQGSGAGEVPGYP